MLVQSDCSVLFVACGTVTESSRSPHMCILLKLRKESTWGTIMTKLTGLGPWKLKDKWWDTQSKYIEYYSLCFLIQMGSVFSLTDSWEICLVQTYWKAKLCISRKVILCAHVESHHSALSLGKVLCVIVFSLHLRAQVCFRLGQW